MFSCKALCASLLLLCFAFPIDSFSQQAPDDHSIVKLNDGSVLIGKYSELENGKASVVLNTGTKIIIDKANTKRIRMADEIELYSGGRFHFNSGLYKTIELGFNPIYGTGAFTFEGGIGTRLSPKWHLGGVLAVSYLEDNNRNIVDPWNSVYYPYADSWHNSLSVQTRYIFGKSAFQWYGSFQAGWSMGHDIDFGYGYTKPDVFFRPGIGGTFASKSACKFYLQLSMNAQHYTGDYEFYNGPDMLWEQYQTDDWMNNFLFSFGVRID